MTSSVQAAYDFVAAEYAEKFFNELDSKPLDRKLPNLFSERKAAAGRVCDVGCGPGEVAAYLSGIGVDVYGIDISEEMIRIASRLTPTVHFEQGDMLSMKAEDNSLGGIVGFYAIVNLSKEQIERACAEFYRTLRPSAPIILSFNVGDEVLHVTDFLGKPTSLDFVFYPVESIRPCLEKAGFRLMKSSCAHPTRRSNIRHNEHIYVRRKSRPQGLRHGYRLIFWHVRRSL